MALAALLRSLARRPLNAMPRIDRPCFVVGSGPGALLPERFDDKWSLATVNASQIVAKQLGCGPPQLTLFGAAVLGRAPASREAQRLIAGKGTDFLLCIKPKRTSILRVKLAMIGYKYRSIFFMDPDLRLAIISDVLGLPIGHGARPSNGVFLSVLCIYLGSPLVVMSGFSLTVGGHAYNEKGHKRFHASEDRRILERIVQLGLPIASADSAFAKESGLPLYRP